MDVFNKFTPQERANESMRLRRKYTDRVPVIIKPTGGLVVEKYKFLIPNDLTLGQFAHTMRNYTKTLKAEAALYYFINNQLVPMSMLLSQIDKQHTSEDGFLYMDVAIESTFGNGFSF